MKYSTGSRGSSLSGSRSGMNRVSRPASRSGPFATASSATSVNPSPSKISLTALSLPRPALRRGIGQFAAERLARIGQRVRDQFLLFAAPGRGDFHLEARLDGERIGQKLGFLDRMRQQDQPGWRLVVVELREERGQHLFRGE